ncbi:DNA replication/repair protein RecF [Luteimonas aestuarii]|uniref:DNA replication and repair protein RecF n=1 Tax=Luteimonas aestuarii TaxID=453837 RepID=A0A4R5TSL8_9GAMM|nr:DNA replication/repair protein RecF [Luteimonas aestuarii]TDK19055.1 DNA replication/repair protein RecF [Luteimonas aestuarii]
MRVTRLEARDLRCFDALQIGPGPGLNLLVGGNGAGKTSVLEALHLMAYGRSFRGRVRDGLVRRGADALEVFVEWEESGDPGRVRKAGLRHTGQAWVGKLDGTSVDQLSQLCAVLEVVSFEPGSHALIDGSSEIRRRYLDWGLFHVEPDFFPVWRKYSRALRQRNALLKAQGGDRQLDSWDAELVEAGEPLSRYRQGYIDRLQQELPALVSTLAPSLGQAEYRLHPGWKQADLPLADALLLARDRDRAVGHTTVGPHRADWQVSLASGASHDTLSRGQAKLLALTCLMAQAQALAADVAGGWPVVVLDDLASELDQAHQQRVLNYLTGTGAQVFISGTELPRALSETGAQPKVFHVEHGRLEAAG